MFHINEGGREREGERDHRLSKSHVQQRTKNAQLYFVYVIVHIVFNDVIYIHYNEKGDVFEIHNFTLCDEQINW